jgi:hypothetical protein
MFQHGGEAWAHDETAKRLGQRCERVGMVPLAHLFEQRLERLASLRLAQLRRQSLKRLGLRPERVGIGRLADLFGAAPRGGYQRL